MATLESRIANVLRNVRDKLSRQELPHNQYQKFVEYNLIQEGLINSEILNDISFASDLFGEKREREFILLYAIKFSIEHKLSIKKSHGAINEYLHLDSTPLTPDAKTDIQTYQQIFSKARERLLPQLKNKTLPGKEYHHLICKVVDSLIIEYELDIPEERRMTIQHTLAIYLRSDPAFGIKIIPYYELRKKEERYFGLTLDQIENLVKTVEF